MLGMDTSDFGQRVHNDGLTRFLIYEGSTNVGFAELERGSGNYFFHNVEIYRFFREQKKGYGMATYLLAITMAHSKGYDFTTGRSSTPCDVRVWQKLVKLGIATVDSPFTLFATREPDYPNLYKGKYFIKPPQSN